MPKKIKSDDAIESKIMPVAERPDHFCILLYGRSGTGKTALSSTWPKPLLLLDINEKGTDTIAKVPGIDVISIEEWGEIEEVYWYLKTGKGAQKYKSVVIDQITQMQDLAMAQVKLESSKEGDDLISRREWGQISGKMKQWLFAYRDLIDSGLYVVLVAHERSSEVEGVEDQIDPTIGARLMPSLASAVNGAVSAIGNTFIREHYEGQGKDKTREAQYCIRIGPHSYYTTKIRRPVEFAAPDFVINPNFEKLQRIIRGEKAPPRRKVK